MMSPSSENGTCSCYDFGEEKISVSFCCSVMSTPSGGIFGCALPCAGTASKKKRVWKGTGEEVVVMTHQVRKTSRLALAKTILVTRNPSRDLQAKKALAQKEDCSRRMRLGNKAETISFGNSTGIRPAAVTPDVSGKGMIAQDTKEMMEANEMHRDSHKTRVGRQVSTMDESMWYLIFTPGFYQTSYGLVRLDSLGGIHVSLPDGSDKEPHDKLA